MTTPDDIVQILQDLPARYPRIVALVWELLDGEGNLDNEKALLYGKEVQEAVEEVTALRHQNHRLLEALKRCSEEDR